MKSLIASIALAFSLSACGGMMPGNDAGTDSGTTPTDSGSNPTDGSSMGDGSSSCLPMGNAAMGMATATATCGACHSADLGGGTMPPGQNLHNDGMGAGGWSDCNFQRALRMGVDDNGRSLCASMPRYSAGDLSDQQIADILAYLKTLTTPGRMTAACQ
jgi:cytochrome c553